MDQVLLDQVLLLPPAERVTFAEIILASIDHEDDEIQNAWLNEVKDRMQSVEEGKSGLVDFERLFHESSNP